MDIKETEKNNFQITIFPKDLTDSAMKQLEDSNLFDENQEVFGLCIFDVEL